MCPPYDVVSTGLIAWVGPDHETEVMYDLTEAPTIHPRLADGTLTDKLPTLAANELLLRNKPITWKDWVAAWGR